MAGLRVSDVRMLPPRPYHRFAAAVPGRPEPLEVVAVGLVDVGHGERQWVALVWQDDVLVPARDLAQQSGAVLQLIRRDTHPTDPPKS